MHVPNRNCFRTAAACGFGTELFALEMDGSIKSRISEGFVKNSQEMLANPEK